MKKNILLLLSILVIAACNNIEKSRTEILTASGNHDTAMERLREITRNIGGEMERWAYYQSETAKTPVSEALSEENRAKLSELQRKLNTYNNQFAPFIQEVGAFAKQVDAQKTQIEAMKTALNAKQPYKGNLKRTLAEINQLNAQTEEKMKVWEERLNNLRKEIESDYKAILALQGNPIQ